VTHGGLEGGARGRSSKGREDRPWGAPDDPPIRRARGRTPDRRPDSHRVGHEIEHADDPAVAVTEIVRRAQNGDDLAFAELYIAFFDRVKRFLVVMLKNPDDAIEVAQDVFERAFRTLDRYEPERGPFRPWLFRIVSNMAIDHLRRERRKRELEPGELPPDAVTLVQRGAALVEHLDPDSSVRDLVDALPEAQRRAVTLRFVFDFNAAEIADVLGTTGDAVRHLQHRALKTLSAALATPRPATAGGDDAVP
jgi:RNA polymerase sigma-70 factor (ECF subfamily)